MVADETSPLFINSQRMRERLACPIEPLIKDSRRCKTEWKKLLWPQVLAFRRNVYMIMYGKSSGFLRHELLLCVGAGELVIWAGRIGTQKLYFKLGELIGIVIEYQRLIRLDFD